MVCGYVQSQRQLDPHHAGFAEDGSLESVISWLGVHRPVAHTDAHGGAYVVTRSDGFWKVARTGRPLHPRAASSFLGPKTLYRRYPESVTLLSTDSTAGHSIPS